MSVPAVPSDGEVKQSAKGSRWSSKLYHAGWQLYHHATKHAGVGIVCSVAYFDPGNWSTDLQAGSLYGYSLLFTVLLAGIFATYLQVLAARLGVVTGLDLASHCRLLFHDRPRHTLLWRWGVHYPLYVLAEIAIVCTDLSEMLGSAIALVLLFPSLPLWATALMTAADVMFLLALDNPLKSRPVKFFEGVIATLVLAVLICMVVIITKVTVNWGNAFHGFVPSKELVSGGSIYTSVGIIGATVMPHSLFLGSHLATQNRLVKKEDIPKSLSSSSVELSSLQSASLWHRVLQNMRRTFNLKRLFGVSRSDAASYPSNVLTHEDRENNAVPFIKAHIYYGMADMIGSLMGFAVVINALILILSGAVFYYNSGAYGNESPASLFDAHALIESTMGKGAGLLFALALLAAGQSASIVATVAGQSVSEGFLRWKISPTLRRVITRLIGLIPAVTIASVVGVNGINKLLVATQVVLSVVLPFFIFPLVWLTSSPRIMTSSSESESTSKPVTPPGSPSFSPIDCVESIAEKETETVAENNKPVDFSSGKIVAGFGYAMWLVITAANVYVIATI